MSVGCSEWGKCSVSNNEKLLLGMSNNALAQAPREVVGLLSLEVFQECGYMALRDVGHIWGHGVWWGLGLDMRTLEVFSNLYDSMVL